MTQRCGFPSVAPSSSFFTAAHAAAQSICRRAFRGQRQRSPRESRPAVARRPDRAAHPTNIAGKHSTTGSTCSASYSRCAAPVHAPSPVKEQRSHVPPFPAPENFSPRQTNPSTDPSSIIPRADAGARAHVRARHRVVPARALRRRLPRQRVRARQPAAAGGDGGAVGRYAVRRVREQSVGSTPEGRARVPGARHRGAGARHVAQPAGVRVRAFRGPQGGHVALVAAWPASIANWTSRLAMETTAFDALSRAVAAKEVAAMRLATQVRRSVVQGVFRRTPTRSRGFWRWCACMWDSAKLMAESGSGRTFRRAMLACSLADWGLLLGAWTALGIQGAATHGAWVQPHSAVVPLAAFLCLDATRLGCQLAHSRLLRRLRTRRLGERPATGASSFVRTPAGMTTGLTRWVFFGNIACFVAVAALGCGGGCWRVPVPPGTTAISLLLLARFHRLMIEGAYLAATLLAKVVDRSGELPVFDLPGADAGGGGYASSISPRYLAPQRNELMGKRPRGR